MSLKKYFLVIIVTLIGVTSGSGTDENHMMDAADITVDYILGDRKIVLEAFRGTKNDEILRLKKTDQYRQLEWHSIGYPFIVQRAGASQSTKGQKKEATTLSNLITFTKTGFYLFMNMLDQKQNDLFREKIRSKYNVRVNTSQVIVLVPSEVKCEVELSCDQGDKGERTVKIKGSALDVREVPIKITFDAVTGSAERKCLEMDLIENHEIEFECEVQKHSKDAKVNRFSIKSTQITEFRLDDKLFGNANEVYVSRNQMANLAADMYGKLDIYEDYEMEEKEFSQAFVEEMIKQTSEGLFGPIEFDKGLDQLSKYNTDDVSPDVIRSQMSKALKVETQGNKKHIVVDKEFSNSQSSKTGDGKDVGGSFGLGIFGLSGSVKTVKERENAWSKSSRSLDDQLTELNKETKNEVEWKFDGEKIVPKSLNLAKLVKSKFKKDISFERIKRVVKDVKFKRNFVLEYEGSPKEVFSSIPNMLIKEDLQPLKETIKFESLATCFQACIELNSCHFVALNQTKDRCNLYDQKAYAKLAKSGAIGKRIVFKRDMFSKKVITGIRLKNSLKEPLKTKSPSACWSECMKERLCVAASYDLDPHSRKPNNCYLAKKGNLNVSFDEDFITLSLANVNISALTTTTKASTTTTFSTTTATTTTTTTKITTTTQTTQPMITRVHENIRLINHYKEPIYSIKSQAQCWAQCDQHSECVAVSFCSKCNGECLLFEKDKYLVTKNDSYVSLVDKSEDLSDMPVLSYYQNYCAEAPELKKYYDLTNLSVCWSHCVSQSECVGILIEDDCVLLKKGNKYLFENDQCDMLAYEHENLDKSIIGSNISTKITGVNPFKKYGSFSYSFYNCLNDCSSETECVAVSYCESDDCKQSNAVCSLFKNGTFKIIENDDYLSIFFKARIEIE